MEIQFNNSRCIYIRTNLVNGKQYIGQANNFKKRENDWNCLKHPYAGSLINRARKKYGLDNWIVEILKECQTQEELNEWEVYYIKEYNTKTPNGYNLNDGGKGQSGFHHTEESREKMSKSQTGKIRGARPNEVKKKISDATKGIRRSLGMTGHHHSDESKKKMSETRKGKPSNASKKVYQYKNGELVATYNSAAEAMTINNYKISGALPSACQGKYNKEGNHTYNGYEWYYTRI